MGDERIRFTVSMGGIGNLDAGSLWRLPHQLFETERQRSSTDGG